ncbi:hypothetical protein [Gemella bergeri]|nr:hypothetical protein [Gemella bergeri]
MINFDVRKSVQYKYIKYKFKGECFRNEALKNLNEDEKEKILIKATKKTRKITWIIIMVYIPVTLLFIFGFVMNYKYLDNPFIKWYRGVLESVFPLINGDWGSAMYEKRGTFLTIYIMLLPALIINAAPLFIPIFITADIVLKNRIKEITERGFENER